jgi:hypothetical protein
LAAISGYPKNRDNRVAPKPESAIERSRLAVDELGVPQPLALGRLGVALVVFV